MSKFPEKKARFLTKFSTMIDNECGTVLDRNFLPLFRAISGTSVSVIYLPYECRVVIIYNHPEEINIFLGAKRKVNGDSARLELFIARNNLEEINIFCGAKIKANDVQEHGLRRWQHASPDFGRVCPEGLLDRGTGSNRSNHEGDYELEKSPQESPKKFLVPID